MNRTISLAEGVRPSDRTVRISSNSTRRKVIKHSTVIPRRNSSLHAVNETVAEIKNKDDNGQTPLHVAAGKGKSAVVKILLRGGAEKEVRDNRKQIPLHLAASSGNFDTALRLLGSGLNAEDKNGQTPLHVAARDGNHQIVQLLVDEGADMDVQAVNLQTPLHMAASNGKSEVVRVLVREGANTAMKDNNDRTPLHLASKNGDSDTVRELVARGVSKAPPPRTTTDYRLYVRKFIKDHLYSFPGFGNTSMKNLARKASGQGKDIAHKWGLSEETTAGLIKLALYDFVLLCDDSNSMELENRKRMLVNTIRRVATFATVLEPAGITVRFLNHAEDDTFDNMADVGDIITKVKTVEYKGDTKLGSVLDRKIVQPMIIQKAKERTLKKPVIVVIITDGEATKSEHMETQPSYSSSRRSEAVRTLQTFSENSKRTGR
ncbi:hypothetical protein GP486_007536 [Trichoglossum hirsutum]|uniref:VWFA domain-containing protein n=1 Tax=Trichoglossum hirsutum TaxID=265104 RepID=A0A9P8L6T3_9PEZI|nr:hypothetical protein GP486_007536 [Trichoglossum hirsutum]